MFGNLNDDSSDEYSEQNYKVSKYGHNSQPVLPKRMKNWNYEDSNVLAYKDEYEQEPKKILGPKFLYSHLNGSEYVDGKYINMNRPR